MLLTTITLQTVLATAAIAAPGAANRPVIYPRQESPKHQPQTHHRAVPAVRLLTPLLGTLAEVLINLLDLSPCEMECGCMCVRVCMMVRDVKSGHVLAGWWDAIYIGCTDRHCSLAIVRAANTEGRSIIWL